MRVSYSDMNVKKKRPKPLPMLPPVGFRIIKTALAVLICLMIYVIRGFQGMVGESVVTTILCIQPFTSDSVKTGLDRLLGTAIGAAWGLLFLILFDQSPLFAQHMVLTYTVISIGVLISIYSTALLKLYNTSAMTAIIFFCVVIDYPNIVSPLLQTKARLIDTLIGVLVGVFINSLTLPRKKIENRVFFVHFQDIAPDRLSTLSSKVSLSLSYLFHQKAKICLMTPFAPAFLLPQIRSLEVTMPCIVMDGAASYDIHFNRYVLTLPIDHIKASILEERLRKLNLGYSVFTIRKDSMMVYQLGTQNKGSFDEYTIMRRSPYRNYMDGTYGSEDQILGIRILVPEAELEDVKKRILTDEILANFSITEFVPQELQGYVSLCFKDTKANFETMQKMVMEYLHYPDYMEVFLMRAESAAGSQVPTERDAMNMLNKIKRLYEPISWLLLDD